MPKKDNDIDKFCKAWGKAIKQALKESDGEN